MDLAVADIIDWLAQNPETTDHIRKMGITLSCHVMPELDGHVRESERQELRRALPGHFWCELLAGLAHAAGVVDSRVGRVPEYAASALAPWPDDQGKELRQSVAGVALRVVWTSVSPLVGDLDSLIRCLRILAILICPNPGRHPAVAQHCLIPLRGDVIADVGGTIRESFGAVEPPSVA